MTTPLTIAARLARVNALRTTIAVGARTLTGYTGLPPASPDEATLETALFVVLLDVSVGVVAASGGLAVLTVTPVVTPATASGVVGWVRIDGVMDLPACKVGAVGAGTTFPVILSDTLIYSGGEVQLVSCIVSE